MLELPSRSTPMRARFLRELHGWLDDALIANNALNGRSIPDFLAALPPLGTIPHRPSARRRTAQNTPNTPQQLSL